MIEVNERFMVEPANNFKDVFDVVNNPHVTGIIRLGPDDEGLIWDRTVGWIQEDMTSIERALLEHWTKGPRKKKPSIPVVERTTLPVSVLPGVSRSDMRQDTAFRASKQGLSIQEYRRKQQEPRREVIKMLKPCPHKKVLVRKGKEFEFYHCPTEGRMVAVDLTRR